MTEYITIAAVTCVLATTSFAQTITVEGSTWKTDDPNGYFTANMSEKEVEFESPGDWRIGAPAALRDRIRFTFETATTSDATVHMRDHDGLEFVFTILTTGQIRVGTPTYTPNNIPTGKTHIRVSIEEDGDIYFRDNNANVVRDSTGKILTVRRDELSQSSTIGSDLVSVSGPTILLAQGGVDLHGIDFPVVVPCSPADVDEDGDIDIFDANLFIDLYDDGC